MHTCGVVSIIMVLRYAYIVIGRIFLTLNFGHDKQNFVFFLAILFVEEQGNYLLKNTLKREQIHEMSSFLRH